MTIAKKISIRFVKEGRFRFLSHHDLMRHWTRALRRADVPVRRTEGYNPKPRLVFNDALPVGMESQCESLELELTSPIPTETCKDRLKVALGEALYIDTIEELAPTRKGRLIQSMQYRVIVPAVADPPLSESDIAALYATEATPDATSGDSQSFLRCQVETRAGCETRLTLTVPGNSRGRRWKEFLSRLSAAYGVAESELRIRKTDMILA